MPSGGGRSSTNGTDTEIDEYHRGLAADMPLINASGDKCGAMTPDGYDPDEGSVGHLACMVLDLCAGADVVVDRLTHTAFVKLAQATARILLVASASDETLIDVRQAKDAFAAESAEVIREIWRAVPKAERRKPAGSVAPAARFDHTMTPEAPNGRQRVSQNLDGAKLGRPPAQDARGWVRQP